MTEYQGLLIVLANFLAFVVIAGVIVRDIKSGRVGKRSKNGMNASSHAAAQRKRGKPKSSSYGRYAGSSERVTFEIPHDTRSGPGEFRLAEHLESVSDQRLAKRKKDTPEGLSDTQLAVIIAGATEPD